MMCKLGRSRVWTMVGLVLFCAAGCGGAANDEPPKVDVTGIWVGTWVGMNESDTGFLILEVFQNGAGLIGEIYLREYYPGLLNVGVEVDGTVSGTTMRFSLRSSSGPVTLEGEVSGESVVGTIEISRGVGTWSATRVGRTYLAIESSFEYSHDYLSPRALTHDGTNLWMLEGSVLYRIDPMDHTGTVVSYDGPVCQSGLAFDGTDLLCTGSDANVYRFSVSGAPIDHIATSHETWPTQIAVDEAARKLWVTYEMDHTLSEFDLVGNLFGEYQVMASINDMVWAGNLLWILVSSPNVLLKVSDTGQVLEAFHLPDEIVRPRDHLAGWARGLAYDGQSLWTLAEYYDETSGSSFYFYRLRLP